jgi:hypothetical protein
MPPGTRSWVKRPRGFLTLARPASSRVRCPRGTAKEPLVPRQ